MSNTARQTGRQGENAACQWLEKQGYTVISRNYTTPHGEIDIIAEDEKYIVFAEVKYRKGSPFLARYGRPVKAVTREKQKHILYAVKCYIGKNRPVKKPRIDVIEIISRPEAEGFVSLDIKHYKNAFGE